MKLHVKSNSAAQSGLLFLASALSITLATATIASPVNKVTQSGATTGNTVAQAQIALAGTFVAAEAPTTGSVQVVEENGQRYLVLDSAFSTTDQAPDLHVILDTVDTPPTSYSDFSTFVNLGGLQNVSGEQRYPIPDAIDISEFKSVVIWCRTANATMGYAILGGSTNASIQ
jgi:hypothetical protein